MTPCILVVDDSLTIRKILEVCLHRAGYEVKTCSDAVEVFDWLRMPEVRIPALVFVDVSLPRMDGYTLIQRLRARPAFASTIFVMISSRQGILDRLKGRLAGASVYLVKPLTPQQILAVVQQHPGGEVNQQRDELNATEAVKTPTYGGHV
jgi:DNA-binding response OmpR family regulator